MEQVLSKLIKIQKDELKKHDGNKDKVAKVLVILDDVIASRTKRGTGIAFNRYLEELFVLGRHLNISFFLLTQHLNSVSIKMKGNADLLCVFKTGSFVKKQYLQHHFIILVITAGTMLTLT